MRDSRQNKRSGIKSAKSIGPMWGAFRVTSIYTIIGSLWMLLSDRTLYLMTKDQAIIESIGIANGLLFVAGTAALIFILVRNALKGEAAYSRHDPLTGLYNRAFFEEELKRMDASRLLPLSIIMGDANNLKLVNDVFGHKEGDDLLQAMARALRASCRAEDVISRWGGDEFVMLLPRTDAERAGLICRRIGDKCAETAAAAGKLHPSISLGYGTKTSAEADISHVIKAAEDMMYKNKLLDSRLAYNEFLAAMSGRLGENGPEAAESAEGISGLCEQVGSVMGLADGDFTDLKTLSLLHDIGKASAGPRSPGRHGGPEGSEWEEIKRHSGIVYMIVRSAPELVILADYILGHHERWDGTGYPQGLKGRSIPLASRIVAVAEAFDAMAQGTPCRPAVGLSEALAEIRRGAGSQFDPEVVDAFEAVLGTLTDKAE